MLWMWMMSAALAGACPWTETPRVVDAGWKTIAVDGTPYPASTFGVVLFDCGEPEAALKLDKWQSMRQWTVGTGVAGCLFLYPAWVVTPITGIIGVQAREDMEDLILDGRTKE
jgi:hypothetical protein